MWNETNKLSSTAGKMFTGILKIECSFFCSYIKCNGDNMLLRIKKMQMLVGVCMLMQIVLSGIWIPFHFIAMFLSVIIILWQKKFKVLQIEYHYYVIYLYLFRLLILLVWCVDFIEMLYVFLAIYVGMMLILLSCKTFL